jgi:hypothetical protein
MLLLRSPIRLRQAGLLAPMAQAWRDRSRRLHPLVQARAAAAASTAGAQQRADTALERPSPRAPQRQTLDYTALRACVQQLQDEWVPSKVEEVRLRATHRPYSAAERSSGAGRASHAALSLPSQPAPRTAPPLPTKVVQPDAYTLSLRLRTPLRQGWLHLSWHPTAARLAAGGAPPRGAASEAFSFAAAASSALRGLVLTGAALPRPWERAAELSFGPRPGAPPACGVVCEVMANYSNVVLTDGSGTVIAAAHQVGGRMSSLRQVQAGRPYAPPPMAAGLPPDAREPPRAWRDNVTRAAELAAAGGGGGGGGVGGGDGGGGGGGDGGGDGGGAAEPQAKRQRRQRAGGVGGGGGAGSSASPAGPTVAGGLVRAYQGVGPSLAAELCASAGVAPGAAPRDLAEDAWDALHAAWLAWLERLDSGSFAATLDESGSRRAARVRALMGAAARPGGLGGGALPAAL